MAAKRTKKFDKNKQVKSIARKQIGSPAPSRPLNERAVRSLPKHKKEWSEKAES
jgi:hypothetical protein